MTSFVGSIAHIRFGDHLGTFPVSNFRNFVLPFISSTDRDPVNLRFALICHLSGNYDQRCL